MSPTTAANTTPNGDGEVKYSFQEVKTRDDDINSLFDAAN